MWAFYFSKRFYCIYYHSDFPHYYKICGKLLKKMKKVDKFFHFRSDLNGKTLAGKEAG